MTRHQALAGPEDGENFRDVKKPGNLPLPQKTVKFVIYLDLTLDFLFAAVNREIWTRSDHQAAGKQFSITKIGRSRKAGR